MIIRKRFFFYAILSFLSLTSLATFYILKPDFGVDLVGGQILEVKTKLDIKEIAKNLQTKVTVYQLQDFYLIKGKAGVDKLWLEINKLDPSAVKVRFEEISSSLSNELKKTSFTAITLVIIAIALYVGYAFRKLKKFIPLQVFSIVVIITLLHDVVMTIGPYAVFSKIFGFDIDMKFILALMVIAGYSISDTIIIMNRLRENIIKSNQKTPQIYQKSVNEVLLRSILTSLSSILAILPLALFVYNLRPFLFALQIGFIVGTYSSILLAAPLIYDLSPKD